MLVSLAIQKQNNSKDSVLLNLKQVSFEFSYSLADDAKKALDLNGYQDPSWVHPIVVLSKEEWIRVCILHLVNK